MKKEKKNIIIKELVDILITSHYFYIIDAAGLSVSDINDFRAKCFKKNIVYKVVKNTLFKKALLSCSKSFFSLEDYAMLDAHLLKSFSGIMFTKEEHGSAPAKIIKIFRKEKNIAKPILKGASIDGSLLIGDAYLESLSKLKTKTELIGDVITLLQSPVHNVIASLQSGKHTLAGIIKTLSDK